MFMRIFHLLCRYLGNMIPPCQLKSFFFRLSGIKIGNKVHLSHGVYIADGYYSGLVELEDGVVLSPYTVLIPSSLQARIIRNAISPLLAIKIFLII